MGDTPKVYLMCDANCKWEGMTKEQILTAITQAVNEGTIGNIDTGFITTVKTINNKGLKFFVGDQNEYEALTDEQKENLFAIITNDTVKEGFLATLEEHKDAIQQLAILVFDILEGRQTVGKARALSAAANEIYLGMGATTTSGIEDNAAYILHSGKGATAVLSTFYYASNGRCYSSPFYEDGVELAFSFEQSTRALRLIQINNESAGAYGNSRTIRCTRIT